MAKVPYLQGEQRCTKALSERELEKKKFIQGEGTVRDETGEEAAPIHEDFMSHVRNASESQGEVYGEG